MAIWKWLAVVAVMSLVFCVFCFLVQLWNWAWMSLLLSAVFGFAAWSNRSDRGQKP